MPEAAWMSLAQDRQPLSRRCLCSRDGAGECIAETQPGGFFLREHLAGGTNYRAQESVLRDSMVDAPKSLRRWRLESHRLHGPDYITCCVRRCARCAQSATHGASPYEAWLESFHESRMRSSLRRCASAGAAVLANRSAIRVLRAVRLARFLLPANRQASIRPS